MTNPKKKSKKKPGGTYKTVENKGGKNARQKTKYPALDTNYVLKIRRDLVDYDYIDKLSEKEKEFLNSFTEEWTGGYFRHGKKQVHPDDLKKDCYSRNNARNRCVYSRAMSKDKVKDVTPNGNNEAEFIR